MKAEIDHSLCIGDGICADTCPEVFEMRDDSLAYVIADPVPAGAEAATTGACDACPTDAIKLD